MIDPVKQIVGLTSAADHDDVNKGQRINYDMSRALAIFSSCAEVRNFDLSGRSRILVGDRLFKKATEDTSEDDGTEATPTVIDDAGNHWVETPSAAIDVDAVGLYAARSAHDAEEAGFVYLSTNGNGTSIADAVLYIKVTAANADWSSAILIRGPRGGDRYEISNWDTDRPASGEELIAHLFTNDAEFPTNFAASRAAALVPSTGTAVYSIKKNGVVIGTLTFSAGITTGAFALASSTTFGAGDRLSVIAPDPRDETLSGVTMTLVADRN